MSPVRPGGRESRRRAVPAALAILVAVSAGVAAQPPREPPPPAASATPATPASEVLAGVNRAPAVRNVSMTADQNEWNPRFSPDGRRLGYERRDGSAQAIFIADLDAVGSEAERVSSLPPRQAVSAEEALLGPGRADDSFNAQLSFHPDGRRFVFLGNGGTGVYRIYESALGASPARAITAESKEDGHPALSPDGRWLVYVSARSGVGKLVLRDLATMAERPLTTGDHVDLYPSWSPDSRSVAYVSGENDNHDVFVIPDVTVPGAAPRQLTSWKFDDLRPVFSPDGALVAFYSNFSPTGEDKEWSIVAVPADGSGPAKGAALAALTVATNVVKDPEVGPAWLWRGRAIVYARNLKAEWNPIYVVDRETRQEAKLETRTRMNHDLTCSSGGRIAFRAQVASWDDIFVAELGAGR